MKPFEHILKATGGNEILAVIEGLPVDKPGYFMTEAQMNSIEERLAASATHADDIAKLTGEKNTLTEQLAIANTASETANAKVVEHEATITSLQSAATTAQEQINTLTSDKTALQAKVTELEAMDGKQFSNTTEDKDDIPDPNKDVDAMELPFQKQILEKVKNG